MNINISTRLLREDEKFWSIVKDEHKRVDYLNRLYRIRRNSLFLMFLLVLMTLIVHFMGENATGPLLLFGSQVLVYLDTESRIRTIKLYELIYTGKKS